MSSRAERTGPLLTPFPCVQPVLPNLFNRLNLLLLLELSLYLLLPVRETNHVEQ